jgi:hypothetical protein
MERRQPAEGGQAYDAERRSALAERGYKRRVGVAGNGNG